MDCLIPEADALNFLSRGNMDPDSMETVCDSASITSHYVGTVDDTVKRNVWGSYLSGLASVSTASILVCFSYSELLSLNPHLVALRGS